MAWPGFDLINIAIGAAAALFGENLIGRVLRRMRRRYPYMQTSILREPDGSWWVKTIVSVAPTQPPLQLYTIRGSAVPQYEEHGTFSHIPVLLENGPGPRPIVVEEFSYLVKHFPLPPEGKHHLLTLHLVGEGVSLTKRYEIHHGGRWREKVSRLATWRERRRFARWARKFGNERLPR